MIPVRPDDRCELCGANRARTAQAEAMFEDMLAIADDGARDRVMVDGKLRVDNEVAARSRLRVDVRRWALSKLAPVKYGEKITNVHEGGERPVEFAGMTEEQLRQWIVKEARALGLGEALRVEVTPTTEDSPPADTQGRSGAFS